MASRNWRTPAVILTCGGVALTIALGVRHNFGLYLQPMTVDLGIGREVFSFAIAIQNLLYGVSQPFTGMIADKFGAARVMIGGEPIATAASAPPVLTRKSLRLCLGEVRRTDRFIVIPPWDNRRPLIPAASSRLRVHG